MSRFRDYFPDKRWWKYSLFVGFTAALLYALYFTIKNFDIILGVVFSVMSDIISAFSPLFIGLVLTYLLSPLVEKINKNVVSKIVITKSQDEEKLASLQKKKRLISVLITYFIILVAIIAILYAFSVLIVGQFIFTGVGNMLDSLISYVASYESNIRSWVAGLPDLEIADKLQELTNDGMLWLSHHFSVGTALSKITEIGGSVVDFVLGIIVSVYILMDKDFFIRLWRKLLHLTLPQKANAVLTETLHDIDGVLSAFIRGAMLDALIIAILSSIGLSILGLDFAVFIGCFAGIANVIPYFGPFLGMVPAFIVGLFTGGLTQGVLAVVTLLVIQQIDCNFIYPKIVGSTTGLHPLFVLLAVSAAGYYGGIFGMILAVPLAGIVQTFILKWVASREAKLSAQLEADSDLEI